MHRREQSVAGQRLREAHFCGVKTLEQIEWAAMEGVSRKTVAELATCAFIEKAENVVIAGPIGTGKTHLGIALGVHAGLAQETTNAQRRCPETTNTLANKRG